MLTLHKVRSKSAIWKIKNVYEVNVFVPHHIPEGDNCIFI